MNMRTSVTPTIDDVARLTRGKRSKNRVGSRQIRHRLRKDELQRLTVARARGFLLLTPSTRDALRNAWHLDCLARKRPCIFVERDTLDFILTGEYGSGKLHERRASLAEVSAFLESL
jgi:hypothetical protein